MNVSEDIRLSLRSIKRRPLESVLLIIGIALGIGACASGIAMVVISKQNSDKILSSVRYREIVVSQRERPEEMKSPAALVKQAEFVLTANDLEAKSEAPDIKNAYLQNPTDLRFGNFPDMGNIIRQNANQGGNSGNITTGGNTDNTANTGNNRVPGNADNAANAGNTMIIQSGGPDGGGTIVVQGNPGDVGPLLDGPPGERGRDFFNQPEVTVDGPKPALEEVRGYEVTPEFFEAWDMRTKEGSLFTAGEAEKGAHNLVLGSNIGKTLFSDGVAIDRKVVARRQIYTVTGILEPTGTNFDEMVFTPIDLSDVQRFGQMMNQFRGFSNSLHFAVVDAAKLNDAEKQLTEYFNKKYGESLVNIRVPRYEAELNQDRNQTISIIILILAVSGLLIAGVNVSNILYSRTLRKRKQIGILKALGASKGNIFGLFLVEALIICIGGAVLGTLISIGFSLVINSNIGLNILNPLILSIGITGSWILTLALTVIPAWQASKVHAADAIRTE